MIRFKKKKQTRKEQIELLEYMYDLIEGGYSLKQALGFLETMVPSKVVYTQILQIFEEGRNFSEVLYLLEYPHMIQTIIQFGERSGMLHNSLKRSVHYLKDMMMLRQKLMKKIQYPAFILAAALLFVFGFRFFLLPQIVNIQQMIGKQETSITSKIVLTLLNVLPYNILICLTLFCVSVAFITYLYKKRNSQWFYLLLKVPFVRTIAVLWNQLQMTMLTRLFFEQGYGVKRLFEEMQKDGYPCHVKKQAEHIYLYLSEGNTYQQSLKMCKIYSKDYLRVIQRGLANKTINVDLAFYERYAQKQLERLFNKGVKIVLPVLYVHVGLLIVLSYLSFVLPMLDLLGTI